MSIIKIVNDTLYGVFAKPAWILMGGIFDITFKPFMLAYARGVKIDRIIQSYGRKSIAPTFAKSNTDIQGVTMTMWSAYTVRTGELVFIVVSPFVGNDMIIILVRVSICIS